MEVSGLGQHYSYGERGKHEGSGLAVSQDSCRESRHSTSEITTLKQF